MQVVEIFLFRVIYGAQARGWGMPGSHYREHAGPIPFDGEDLFAFILDYDPNLVFVKDGESRIVYANKAFREVYPPDHRDAILGSTTVESFDPKEAELFLAEDRRAMEQGHSEIVEEITDWKGDRLTLLTRKFSIVRPEAAVGLASRTSTTPRLPMP